VTEVKYVTESEESELGLALALLGYWISYESLKQDCEKPKGSWQRRRKNQLDAVKLKFIDVIHSTYFRHHYAHHQEYRKGRQTAYGVLHWSCSSGLEELRWIPCALDGCGITTVMDLRSWGGSRVYLMAVVNHSNGLEEMRWIPCAIDGCGYTLDPPHLLKSTTARPVQNTVCSLCAFTVLLMMGIMMPETCWVYNINKLQLNCI
jgi:hypothetical protein